MEEEDIGKFKQMLDNLQDYINNIENPFNQRIYINENKISNKYLNDIDFKMIEYIITPNLPDNIAFCIVNKDTFDKFSDIYKNS